MKNPVLILAGALFAAGCGNSDLAGKAKRDLFVDGNGDDVVVIAVVDTSINPYHWDYLAEKMPQHLNDDASDDLPLDEDPATWLPGHPGAAAFASYTPMNLTLTPDDEKASTADAFDEDIQEWGQVRNSEGARNDQVHMYWMPGTKVIGHVAFSDTAPGAPVTTWAQDSHGVGTSSVSVGNIHGTCPNCLLVYVHGSTEQAAQWVAAQDWIDLQTNSFGHGFIANFTLGLIRDLVYTGTDLEIQRNAVERGQAILFSGGNGLANDFSVPHTNLVSSEKGPDWVITVGAISPTGGSFSGHGKPSDVASLGDGYPSATGGDGSVTAAGDFGGTSNATPVVAGIYGEALYRLRRAAPGDNRIQADGVIATTAAGCGAANADCALADGKLTVHEMRTALYRAAQYTAAGTVVGSSLLGEYLPIPMSENQAELEFLSEGHGSYLGRLQDDAAYEAEVQRLVGFVNGDQFFEEDADQRAWFVADATCRQAGWGVWGFGEDQGQPLPAPDPQWPIRTWLTEVCPQVLPPLIAAERVVTEAP